MPRYQVEIGGKRYEIEAPTPEAAQGAVQRMQSQAPAGQTSAQDAASMRGRFDDAHPSVETRQRVVTVPSRQIIGPIYDHRSYVMDGEANPRDPALQSALQERAAGVREKINQRDDLPMWEEFDSPIRSIASGVPVLGAFADAADPRPEQDARFAAQYPAASKLLPLAGGMAATGLAAGTRLGQALFGVTGANLPARIATGGATGAAIGGVDAGIRNDWDPTSIGIGGTVGGVTGGAIPAIGSKLGKWFGDQPAPRATGPSIQQMEESADALYRAAREAGLTVRPESFSRFTWDLANAAKEAGFNARMHPKIAIALDEASDMMGKVSAPSLREMDILRRLINDAGLESPDQGRLAGVLVDRLDGYLARLTPADIATGDSAVGVGAITRARELWSRMKKAEQIEGIFERATNAVGARYTQAGMTTALRQQFRQLADGWTRNPRLRNMWTKEEQDAILRVVRGAPLENTMRLLGKFAPRGLLSATLSGGAGYTLAGPVGSAALMAAGEFGERVSSALSRKAAERVDLLVRSGQRSIAPPPRPTRPVDEATTRFLQSVAMPSVPLLASRLGPAK